MDFGLENNQGSPALKKKTLLFWGVGVGGVKGFDQTNK